MSSIIIKVPRDGDLLPFVYFPNTNNAFVTYSGHRMSQDLNINCIEDFLRWIQEESELDIAKEEWNYLLEQLQSGAQTFTFGLDMKVIRPTA